MNKGQTLAYQYVQKFGSIIPAHLANKTIEGIKYPSELPKRCRELRAQGKFKSHRENGYEKFYLPEILNTKTQEAPMSYGRGYKKFQQMGEWLKEGRSNAKKPQRDYGSMSTEELLEKRAEAEKWLKANENHPRYQIALERYQTICDELEYFRYQKQETI